MIGNCVRDFGECSCNCHRWPDGTVKHIHPCCYPCQWCGKGIVSYVSHLGSHEDKCRADHEALIDDMAERWRAEGKPLSDEEIARLKKRPFRARFSILRFS